MRGLGSCGLVALLLPGAMAASSSITLRSRPPRVDTEATDFGGGSARTLRHGRPMQEQGSSSPVAELKTMPSWQDFYRDYVRANRPLVLRGTAAEQPAFGLWTDSYLSDNWGSRVVNVEVNKTEERGAPSVRMPFNVFLREMYNKGRQHELYALVEFDGDKKAKADLDMPRPIDCTEIAPQSVTLWISSGGTSSVLHQDDAENLLMQLSGRKTAMLVHQDHAADVYAHIASVRGTSPVHQAAVDLEAFPRFAEIPWLKAELLPGDTLYIPHSYWHQVVSHERNLAVNLWWGHREEWHWWNPGSHSEYDATRLGTPGFSKFDEVKARGLADAPCTPLAPDRNLSKIKFMTEGVWKQYLARRILRAARERREL